MSLVTIFFGSTLPVPTIFIMLKLFKSTDISLKKSDKNTSYYPIQKIFVVIDLYCRYYYIGKWLKSGEMYLFVVKISTFAEYLEYLHRLMNKELPKYLLEKRPLMGTVTFSVLFALVFLNLYIPFSDTAWFGLGNSVYFLFTAGFAFVSLLILIVSRVALYKLRNVLRMTYLGYVLWCVAEVILICLFYTFVTMDITDPGDLNFIQVLGKSLLYGTISLIVPYIISGMYFAIIDKNNTIRLMHCKDVVSDEPELHHDTKITLFDNNGALKLSLSSGSLFYIESDDNYIKVWYSDNKGALKMYMLRCRLKTVEDSFRNGPLVRCHRKYIVNTEKVKVLRKENEGYVLILGDESVPPIPVSKTYTDNVLKIFSSLSAF